MSVPYHLMYLIKKLYEEGMAAVRVDGIDSGDFSKLGLGFNRDVSSHSYYLIYTEYIMRIVLDGWDKDISMGEWLISNL